MMSITGTFLFQNFSFVQFTGYVIGLEPNLF